MEWKTISWRRYLKLTHHLHESDGANEPAQNGANYDQIVHCTRFIQCSTWYETALPKATSLDKIQQLMKAWLPLRTDVVMYNIYLPNQSRQEFRCGYAVMLIQHICINLRCILVNRKTPKFGLGYDVMMRLCWDISGKNGQVYCDNLFTSVQLLKDFLACKTYCSGTVWVDEKYLPKGIHKPGRIICSAYKSYQDGCWNMMATVWQDNRVVRHVSTNSNPRNVVHTDRRLGNNVIPVNQLQNIQLYNRYTWMV